MTNISCKNIWILLSLLPSLALSSTMVDDQPRSHAFSRSPVLRKEGMPNPPRVPQRMALSKEMEERVRATLEGGLVHMDENEVAYVGGATEKARALFVSLYHSSEKDSVEDQSLQSIFSSKPMATAQASLATMRKELTTLAEELTPLTEKCLRLTKRRAAIEKDLGVLTRAIQIEETKKILKDPKKPANLGAIRLLEKEVSQLKAQKGPLEEEMRLPEEQRKALEKKKEQKEGEVFVQDAFIKLREKRYLLSQEIQAEETRPKVNAAKLKYLKDKREALDAEGLDPIFTQVALKMMQQEDKRLAQEQEKVSFSQVAVNGIKQKRTAIRSAMEKFSEARDKKRRVKRIFSLVKEKLSPTEIENLILGKRSVITNRTFFTDRIVLLERLTALPPQIRQKLMQHAQRFISPAMSGDDRALIAKAFAQFERAEDGDQFSKDLDLNKDLSFNKEGTPPPRFIQRAANTWRASRHKFRNSFSRIRSFRLKASQELVDNFLGLSPDVQNKFLSLFSKSLSADENNILYVLTGIERRNQDLESRDPETKERAEGHIEEDIENIEEMAKFKEQDPTGYEIELKRILAYYKQNPDTCLQKALEEKKKGEKEALRKAIMKQLLEATLRASIREDVEKTRLRKIAESKTPDTPLLRVEFKRQLAREVEELTNQRFMETLRTMPVREKQKMEADLAAEVEERLRVELGNVQLLQMHSLLAPFDSKVLEEDDDDVFEPRKEGRDVLERRKQLAPPPSPTSPRDSGNESTGSTDA